MSTLHYQRATVTFVTTVMLMQQLLPASIAGDMFVFQQDSAPAHRTRDTIKLLRRDDTLPPCPLPCPPPLPFEVGPLKLAKGSVGAL